MTAGPVLGSAVHDPLDEEPAPTLPRVAKAVGLTVAALVLGLVLHGVLLDTAPDSDLQIAARFEEGGSLRTADDGRTWQVTGGTFAAADGVATATAVVDDLAFAVLERGDTDGEVAATVSGETGANGLVFRYRDERNHWRIAASTRLGTWVVLKVVDGQAERVTTTGLSGTGERVRLSVQLVGDEVHVLLGGSERATISDPTLADATAGGIFAGPDGVGLPYDDVVATPAP